jgi:polyisoprenoid-binding protein YceI
MNSKAFSVVAFGAAAALALASVASAQPAMPKPVKDYKAAPAGAYAIDPSHTGLVVRAPHMGFSYEIFRFQTVGGNLTWDPANPGADALNVTVDPKSITTAPTGAINFPDELTGDKFLNVVKFPTATFVSKGFHPTDATHGKVDGDLTIMGVTSPASFDVELVGAGQGFKGPVIGVTARTQIDPKGLGLPPFITGPIEIIIDTEFDKK